MKAPHFIWLIIILFSVKCNNPSVKSVIIKKPGKNEIADINRYFVQKDRERIQNYIERKNLSMKESSNGLWYYIKRREQENTLPITIRFHLIMFVLCLTVQNVYSSDKLGPKDLS